MRSRLFILFALAAMIFVAGCERSESSPFTAEIDEPGYRRGKELKKQGRNQEALSEFLKVLDKRGLSDSPESHLELGLLYEKHINDPIAAIFHYRKFRELKPNSQQADLVRQRIDAATRNFARTLPGLPLENQLDRTDMSDMVLQLQRENEKLKTSLAAARAGRAVPDAIAPTATPDAETNQLPESERPALAAVADVSPVVRAAPDTESTAVSVVSPPAVRPPLVSTPAQTQQTRYQPPTAPTTITRPATTRPGATSATTATRPAATGTLRKHTISKGDTLYSLAQKYYGNRSRWKDIYNANKDVMRSADDYKIGMELKIPQ